MTRSMRTIVAAALIAVLASGCSAFGQKGTNNGNTSSVNGTNAASNNTTPEKGKEIQKELLSKNTDNNVAVLYFGNSDYEAVSPEKREIHIEEDKTLEEAIIRELLKGPASDKLEQVIPQGTKLLSIETKDGICSLNLSEEFVRNNNMGTAGEAAVIYSIVNTLTELPYIKKVQFLVQGRIRDVYIHSAFDEPFERNEKFINPQD